MPKRIQRKRTKGWKMPENAVYVGRPTLFGNMFTICGNETAQDVVDMYRAFVMANRRPENGPTVGDINRELRGKDLACWCPLDKPCHADVLLELANH
jgi:hypothetical protein